jgi:hypothetical protein
MNGVFKAKGFQTVQYEMPTVVIPSKPAVVEPVAAVEVPTVAAKPVLTCHECDCTGVFDYEIGQWTCGDASHHSVKPEPTPVAPEPVVAPEPTPEPVVSEVEAPLEVAEAAPESGLVPEDPPAE